MITSAKKAKADLEKLLPRVDRKLRLSRERLMNFSAACEKEGFNNHSYVLENLISQLNEKINEGKSFELEASRSKDREPATITCSDFTWNYFHANYKNLAKAQASVLEHLMGEYISQVEKKYKIKIVKGKVTD